MRYEIAAPALVVRTFDGKVLFAEPLRPVPVAGCAKWNARIGAKQHRRAK